MQNSVATIESGLSKFVVALFIIGPKCKNQNVLQLDKLWCIHTMKHHKLKKKKKTITTGICNQWMNLNALCLVKETKFIICNGSLLTF